VKNPNWPNEVDWDRLAKDHAASARKALRAIAAFDKKLWDAAFKARPTQGEGA
jgi:hypothetical protein